MFGKISKLKYCASGNIHASFNLVLFVIYSDMCEIKFSIKYSLENYLSHKKSFILVQ